MLIKNYISRELRQKTLWVFGILTLIVALRKFVSYMADAAAGSLPSDFIFKMLAYKMLSVIPRFLPVALFIAVLLSFAKLARDQELTAMTAIGLGHGQQLRAGMRFIVPVAIGAFCLTFWLSPWGETNFRRLQDEANKVADYSGILPGTFKALNSHAGVAYINDADNEQHMQNVFLQLQRQLDTETIRAKDAYFAWEAGQLNRYLYFKDGTRYIGTPGSMDYRVTDYETYAVLIESKTSNQAINDLSALPTATLLRFYQRVDYQAELQWRLSTVLACLLLSILAMIMVQRVSSERKSPLFFSAILIYFLYSNMLGVAKALLARGKLADYVGLWWVHLLLLLCIWLWYAQPRIAHRLRRRPSLANQS